MAKSNSRLNQRQRLLAYLTNRNGGATTLQIIDELDILRPAARVFELKEQGHNIVTHMTHGETHLGKHKIAHYVLMP